MSYINRKSLIKFSKLSSQSFFLLNKPFLYVLSCKVVCVRAEMRREKSKNFQTGEKEPNVRIKNHFNIL